MSKYQKDLAELEENGHIDYRGFRIYQCRKIDRYEKSKVSGHSWPVYKMIRKFSVEAIDKDLVGLRVTRESGSIKDAKLDIDIALKFPHDNMKCSPTEFPIKRFEDCVLGQYVRANLVPVANGLRPIFQVTGEGVAQCVDRREYSINLKKAFAIDGIAFFGINSMTLDQSLVRPHAEVMKEAKAAKAAKAKVMKEAEAEDEPQMRDTPRHRP